MAFAPHFSKLKSPMYVTGSDEVSGRINWHSARVSVLIWYLFGTVLICIKGPLCLFSEAGITVCLNLYFTYMYLHLLMCFVFICMYVVVLFIAVGLV